MTPYRVADGAVRYVCMVCLGYASSAAEVCPQCAVALSDSDEPEAGVELLRLLRARAVASKSGYERRRMGWAFGLATPLSLAGMVGMAALGVPLPRPSTNSGMGVLLPAFLLLFILAPLFYTVLPILLRPPTPSLPEPSSASLSELVDALGLVRLG